MVSTSESDVTINLPLHDLALGRVSFDSWLFLRSAWPKPARGRHFSPSLPGDKYLKLGPKSDLRTEISETIVRYVYKYCAQSLFFMAIQSSGYIVYATSSVLKLMVLLNSF